MQPLSATDAIAPAWQHTRRLLLGPRNPRLFFKIAAVAFFAEMMSSSFSFSPPFHNAHTGGGSSPSITAAIIGIIFICAVVGLLIGLVFFYLSSRLQFTIFHVVLRSETTVAPVWRRYGPATWRWMGLKILFFLCAFACLAPLLIPGIFFIIHAITLQSHGDNSHIISFILTGMFFVFLLVLFVLALAIATVLLRDFALPSMALEGTPLRETVRRVLALTRAEPGQVTLYLLLRFCLTTAGVFVSEILIVLLATPHRRPACRPRLRPLGHSAHSRRGRPRGNDRRLGHPGTRPPRRAGRRRHLPLRISLHLPAGLRHLLPRWPLPAHGSTACGATSACPPHSPAAADLDACLPNDAAGVSHFYASRFAI